MCEEAVLASFIAYLSGETEDNCRVACIEGHMFYNLPCKTLGCQ
jgi:hypothetical protein